MSVVVVRLFPSNSTAGRDEDTHRVSLYFSASGNNGSPHRHRHAHDVPRTTGQPGHALLSKRRHEDLGTTQTTWRRGSTPSASVTQVDVTKGPMDAADLAAKKMLLPYVDKLALVEIALAEVT